MKKEEIAKIVQCQRSFYNTHCTLPVKFRVDALKKLRNALIKNEDKICAAIKSDLGKSSFESYMCEVGLVISEISFMLKHIKKFAKEKTVLTPITHFASRSFVKPQPYGNVLIMSPWNYPLLLSLDPLVCSIAAGNTTILKPSAYSPATSLVIKEMLEEIYPAEYISVISGGREENQHLLDEKFDFIFFTGSKNVGRTVLEKAAVHLTPAVLELGGKSPCIVTENAKISLAATRIVFGKYLNCGQTCVAPDYILCHESIKDKLISSIKKEIIKQYGENPLLNPSYGKMINRRHFDRVYSLINQNKVVFGGTKNDDSLQICPTVLQNVTYDDAVMQEEIFGPVMPIITYKNFDDVLNKINADDKPLAFYIFSQNKEEINKALSHCQFGGGCVNDTIIHLATSRMGFGGVGESGMGAYHGKVGFDAFSHQKSIVNKKTWLDLPMRYQPYKKLYEKLLRLFLK